MEDLAAELDVSGEDHWSVPQDARRKALQEAVHGCDLRPIDGDGNRVDLETETDEEKEKRERDTQDSPETAQLWFRVRISETLED